MTEYIKQDNTFLAYSRAPAGTQPVRDYGELQRLGKDWSGKVLVDLYNAAAASQGKDAVKRFMNRDAGMKRLWTLLQGLPVAPATSATAAHDRVSKKATVLEMVQSSSGATLDELMSATGWQAHYADVQIMPTCVGNPACGAGIAAMESA